MDSITHACPVKSVYVLKNGLPVFTREFDGASSGNEMLVSGFFSALTSFLKDMQGYGEMRTLVTSNDTRFTFYQADGLLFVACTSGTLSEVDAERLLRRTCMKFMESYGAHVMATNTVNTKTYAGFGQVLERDILAREVRFASGTGDADPRKPAVVPRLLVSKERVRQELGPGEAVHQAILEHVDGSSDVKTIARLAGIEETKVHASLRYLAKQGILQA